MQVSSTHIRRTDDLFANNMVLPYLANVNADRSFANSQRVIAVSGREGS
jgi:hypothetical protein